MNMKKREIIDLQLSLVLFANMVYSANLIKPDDKYNNELSLKASYEYISEKFKKFLGIKLSEEEYKKTLPCESFSELYYNISSIIGIGNLKPQALSMLDVYKDNNMERVLDNFPNGLERYASSFGIHPNLFKNAVTNNMLNNKDLNRLINLHFILS